MKKIGIITIYDNDNYGNRLQNYATQCILEKFGDANVETIKNQGNLNKKSKYFIYQLKKIKNLLKRKRSKRYLLFKEFNKNIKLSKKNFDFYKVKNFQYDYYIIGSDQVWNPNYRLSEFDLASFVDSDNKISFSASMGVASIKNIEKYANEFLKFKAISVREDAGKKILNDIVPQKDIKVLVDPTMLLDKSEWERVTKKPRQMDIIKNKKYILNYFLGEIPNEWKKEIERIANNNQYYIINLLDKNDPFYETGPSEFLYLEEHAELICTDSFHSSVFAILFDTKFVVFKREQKGIQSMESRIETLLNKFQLNDRLFQGNIDESKLNNNYSIAKDILVSEKQKSIEFLKKAIN